MTLKSASKQNIIASKCQILTWKFTVKFQKFSNVGGLRPQNPSPKKFVAFFISSPTPNVKVWLRHGNYMTGDFNEKNQGKINLKTQKRRRQSSKRRRCDGLWKASGLMWKWSRTEPPAWTRSDSDLLFWVSISGITWTELSVWALRYWLSSNFFQFLPLHLEITPHRCFFSSVMKILELLGMIMVFY